MLFYVSELNFEVALEQLDILQIERLIQ